MPSYGEIMTRVSRIAVAFLVALLALHGGTARAADLFVGAGGGRAAVWGNQLDYDNYPQYKSRSFGGYQLALEMGLQGKYLGGGLDIHYIDGLRSFPGGTGTIVRFLGAQFRGSLPLTTTQQTYAGISFGIGASSFSRGTVAVPAWRAVVGYRYQLMRHWYVAAETAFLGMESVQSVQLAVKTGVLF
ncbi:MAG: hypothetical protein A2289_21955 [Deltaproteobacteria bacterium RIFOXYA12_FULL_58_15]|nr:MAG: hypothetical protein A2289_21955 [Deltaproteobacteria bacterium RIFOXYA12_FULL_58_15]